MKLYLVRHGESVGNKKDTVQHPEDPLSQEGLNQVEGVAERFKNVTIDFIYTSNLKRAKETSEAIAKKLNIEKIEEWQDLKEYKRPSHLFGKFAQSPEFKEFENAREINKGNPDYKFTDEESFRELNARAKAVLAHLLKNHKDKNVLLVSHGTFIKMIASTVLFSESLTSEMFWIFVEHSFIKNTGVTIFEHRDGHAWRLVSWNDMSHL